MRLLTVLFALLVGSQAWASETVKVLTYNVYAKPDLTNTRMTHERMELICQRLKEASWDIVLLQEVWTKGYRGQFKDCGYPHVMDLKKTGKTKREGHLGSGLMILSKFPLEEQQRKVLVRPTGFKAIFKHGEGIVWKSLYLARARLPSGRTLWVGATHLVANYCDTGDFAACSSYQDTRYKQLNQISEHIAKTTHGEPLVIGGDFNFGPHQVSNDRSWQEFASIFPGYTQAPYTEEDCTSCSSNTFKDNDNGKIDHIYVSPGLKASAGARVFTETVTTKQGKITHLSDHYGWESLVEF